MIVVFLMSCLHVTLLIALCVFWLVPFMWVGTKLGRAPLPLPRRLLQQYNTAALFTHRSSVWTDWRVEIKQRKGTSWCNMDMIKVAPMQEAGHRLRVERMLADTLGKKTSISLRKRLAEWIARRLKQQEGVEISGLRIRRALWQTNTPELNFPLGHWERGGGAIFIQ